MKKKIKNFDSPKDFVVAKFSPTLWDKVLFQSSGCGATCLGTLLNKNPAEISKENRYHEHFSDKFVISKLKKHGFKILPLNKKQLTIHRNTLDPFKNIIQDNHILLTSQQLTSDTASWLLYYGDYMLHNCSILKQKVFDLFQYPVLSAYLVWHKKYK